MGPFWMMDRTALDRAHGHRGLRGTLGFLLLMAFSMPGLCGTLLWEEEQQRLQIGLKLFPAYLGALEEVPASAGSQGAWHIVIVHRDDPETAVEVRDALEAVPRVQGLPLRVKIVDVVSFGHRFHSAMVNAIFVASVDFSAHDLRAWSEQHQTLVFSPFSGDVERGAVAGLYVAERILPYINLIQTSRAGLSFSPLFLRIAHHIE